MNKKWYTQTIFDNIKDPLWRRVHGDLVDHFEIIQLLTNARIRKYWTQEFLAEKLGISQPSLARIESGRVNPSLRLTIKIARALGLKIKVS